MDVAPAYLSLKELATYSGLCVRTLRARLNDPLRPLPHYRIGGRVLVRASDFDTWAATFRTVSTGRDFVGEILKNVR